MINIVVGILLYLFIGVTLFSLFEKILDDYWIDLGLFMLLWYVIIPILIFCYFIKFIKNLKLITKLSILFIISSIFIFSIYKPFNIKIKFIKTTENSKFIPLTEKEKITYEIKILEEKKKELEKEL